MNARRSVGESKAAVFNAWLHVPSMTVGNRMRMITKGRSRAMVIGIITAFNPRARRRRRFQEVAAGCTESRR